MHCTRNLWLSLGVLAASGCTVNDPQLPQLTSATSPLINGTHLDSHPEVTQIHWTNQKSRDDHTCTATMITSRVFTTAAHCVEFAPLARGVLADDKLNFWDTSLPDKEFDMVFSQGGELGEDDFAVGRLRTPASGFKPMEISTRQPSDEELTVIGYGCTESQAEDCSVRDRTYVTYFYDGSGSDLNAKGDSGGPTYLGKIDDGGAMVRITSAGYDWQWWGGDVGADVVKYRDHILAMSTALTGTGVSYRAHVQSQGWQPAVMNGGLAGTLGQQLRVEGLQVWLPQSDVTGDSICYEAHVEDQGWQNEVCDGDLAGTVGQGKRLEAIRMHVNTSRTNCDKIGPLCHVTYNVWVEGIGWTGWTTEGNIAGTTGEKRRIEAIAIALI